MSTYELEQAGKETIVAKIKVQGGGGGFNVGDVPTQQPDGSLLQAPGGGSTPVKQVRVPIAFDTPDLVLTGIPIYTPAAGEYVVPFGGIVSVTTAWDGTTPQLNFGYAGAANAYAAAFGTNLLSAADNPFGGGHAAQPPAYTPQSAPVLFLDAEPLYAMVDDGAGGDPGSTHGAGEIVLLVVAAS